MILTNFLRALRQTSTKIVGTNSADAYYGGVSVTLGAIDNRVFVSGARWRELTPGGMSGMAQMTCLQTSSCEQKLPRKWLQSTPLVRECLRLKKPTVSTTSTNQSLPSSSLKLLFHFSDLEVISKNSNCLKLWTTTFWSPAMTHQVKPSASTSHLTT